MWCTGFSSQWLLVLQSTGSRAHGLLLLGSRAWSPSSVVVLGLGCSEPCGHLPRSGSEPVSPALAGRFFSSESPRKPQILCFHLWMEKLNISSHPWMEKPNSDRFPSGEYLDILAISCDSFDEQVNVLIGRGQGKKNHVENLQKLRTWCKEYRVAFKINSVINRFNVDEDMKEQINALNPVRWKVQTALLL